MSKYYDHFFSKYVYEWKIENFLNRKYNYRWLDSPKFRLLGANFCIRIYPDGEYTDDAGWVAIYLHKASSATKLRVGYTLGLKHYDGSILVSLQFNFLFPPGDEKYGYSKIIKKSKLTSTEKSVFGPKGTLTVFCEVREVEDVSAVNDDDDTVEIETRNSSTDAFQTLSEDFEKIYVSGCQTDVVMVVRGKKFSTHRSILSARSSVFRSMFELDMKEKVTGVINIIDCDPESFGAFLLFLYSAKLDVVTSDNALGLYATADKYNVQDLKRECCECLARELSVDSICDVLHVATLYEEQELLKHAKAYFVKNANEVLTTVKWHTFLKENLTVANELFIEALNKKVDP